jgi:hypothetical protein
MTRMHASRSIDESEASRRRRAVHKSLAPFLQGKELMSALWLWEEGANTGSVLALKDYVARICNRPKLQELRAAVHLALVRSMTLPLANLGPDPWPLMQAARRNQTPTSMQAPLGDTSGTEVFEYVLDQLFYDLRDRQQAGINRIRVWLHERLGSHLDGLGMDASMAAGVVRWLNGSSPHVSVLLPIEVMRRLVHAVYLLACEYYGPVVTDAALARAIRAAETLPAARRFSPQELLDISLRAEVAGKLV